ncbi:MAG: heme A synthase [Chloroflexi bacterium]|nr:heme A synthase [Chloroflexota bacterium]
MTSPVQSPVLPDRSFQRLAIVTSGTIFTLMVVGGLVRATGSGLGCPDWPLCYGQVLPPAEVTAWIEFAHRFVAAVGGLLIIATVFVSWRKYRHLDAIVLPAAGILSLLVVQVPLGALVVASELEPISVAVHLGMALIILSFSLTITAAAFHYAQFEPSPLRLPRGYQRVLLATLGATFLLLMSGALVVGSRASYACPDWPLCHGGLLPPANANPLIWIQMSHRYLVAAVSILIVAAVVMSWRLRSELRGAQLWTAILAGAFVAQIIIGAVQVWLHLPTLWRILHLAMGTTVWGAVTMLGVLALLQGSRAFQLKPRSRTQPVTAIADRAPGR